MLYSTVVQYSRTSLYNSTVWVGVHDLSCYSHQRIIDYGSNAVRYSPVQSSTTVQEFHIVTVY